MDEPSSGKARQDLELKKLNLEFDILDQSRSAEADKLALEIHEMEAAPRRATIAALSTVLLGVAGILISLAGFVLNRTIDNSAEKQRAFDNYIGLSKQFAQTGAQKIAAIVGFRQYLQGQSDKASQTVAILANDLNFDTDPIAVRYVVEELSDFGLGAFSDVRNVNAFARRRVFNAALGYLAQQERLSNHAAYMRSPSGLTPQAVLAPIAPSNVFLGNLLAAAFSGNRFASPSEEDARKADLVNLWSLEYTTMYDRLPYNGSQEQGSPQNDPLQSISSSTLAFLASGEILSSLLQQQADMRGLDASEIAIFDVNASDINVSQVNFSKAFIAGSATGVNFAGSDLSFAELDLSYRSSANYRTSFCAATLYGAQLYNFEDIAFGSGPIGPEVSVDDWTVNKDLPDFTAADWWDVDGIDDDVKTMLEHAYPKKIEEPLTHLKTEDKMKHCASRATIRHAGTARNG